MDESRHVRAFRRRHVRRPEKVLAWAHADARDDKGKAQPLGDGALVVTTRRVAFFRKGVFWDRLEWVDLWDVSSIARSSRWGTEVYAFAGVGFRLVVGCRDDVGFADCVELVEAARDPDADAASLVDLASTFKYAEPQVASGVVRVLRVGVPFVLASFVAGRVVEWTSTEGPSEVVPSPGRTRAGASADASVADVRRKFESSLSALRSPLVGGVSVDRRGARWTVTVTVGNLWHVRAYQIRLQDAQQLWMMWSRVAPCESKDDARISIVDRQGNEVGGSHWLSGAMVWVQEK